MRFLWLLFLIPFVSSGQHAVIRGVAPLAIGEEIQLRVYDDPISGKERILSKQIIDVDGSFELKVVPNEVQYAFLQVGRECADFFIEREKDVELSFVPPKRDDKKPRAFNERHFFIPKITGGKSAKLNEQIIQFNASIDKFLESIYPQLKQRRSPGFVGEKVAEFEAQMLKDFNSSEAFVQDYIKYSIAGIEQTFLSDRDRLHNKYLKGKRVQFNNPSYVNFVLQFYQGEVYKIAVVNKHEECKKLLDGKEAFAKMDELLLAAETKLQDVSLRRMVLIEGIDGLFGQKDFEAPLLIDALKDFGMLSSNSYVGSAAKNIAAKHEKLAVGTFAPDIVFNDLNGTEKQLTELQGTYVFLELTDAKNAYCQRETNVIPNLKSEFKNVRFVTVCVGDTKAEMQALQKQMNIDWDFGGVSLSNAILEDYDIQSLPLFFIIDPEGKFYRSPGPDPTKGAQQELLSLNEKLKAKNKSSVGK